MMRFPGEALAGRAYPELIFMPPLQGDQSVESMRVATSGMTAGNAEMLKAGPGEGCGVCGYPAYRHRGRR